METSQINFRDQNKEGNPLLRIIIIKHYNII